MNIAVDISYPVSKYPLLVTFSVPGHRQVIDLANSTNCVVLNVTVPNEDKNQVIDLVLQTDNLYITQSPLEIKSILLDNFYQRQKFSCQGRPIYTEQFLQYANAKNITIDCTVTDCNRLDFLGQLVFSFKWPFWRNLLKDD